MSAIKRLVCFCLLLLLGVGQITRDARVVVQPIEKESVLVIPAEKDPVVVKPTEEVAAEDKPNSSLSQESEEETPVIQRAPLTFTRYTGSGSIFDTLFPHRTYKINCPLSPRHSLIDSRCKPIQLTLAEEKARLIQTSPTRLSIDKGELPSNPRLLQEDVNHIRDFIWDWYSGPIGQNFSPYETSQTQTQSQTPYEICRLTSYEMSEPSEDLLNIDGNLDVLYPGAFIQSKYVSTGTESLVNLPFPQNKRYNIRVFEGNSNFNPVFSDSPSGADVQRTIKQAIQSSSGFTSGNFYYDFAKSTEMKSLAINFNFNAKIMKKLDLDGGFEGNWQTKKNKFVLAMVQKLHTVGADLYVQTPGEVNDPLGVFVRPEMTVAEAQNMENYGWWGDQNPPVYISEVYYGRMLIVTIDETEATSSIYAELSAAWNSGSANINTLITSFFSHTSKKVVALGPFHQNDVTNLMAGNWESFLQQVPADHPSLQALKPIGFRLRDFKGRPVKVSNILQYDSVQCDPKPTKTVKIRVSYIIGAGAWVQLKRPSQNSFATTLISGATSNSGWIDITSSLGVGDNELKVSSQVAWVNSQLTSFNRWQRRVVFEVSVDNDVKYSKTITCVGCHSNWNVIYCEKVNKYTGAVQCQANE